MRKWKIKKRLRKNKQLHQYNATVNYKFRYVLSMIAFIFNSELSIAQLCDIEVKLSHSKKENEQSFSGLIKPYMKEKGIDWYSLEVFLWYIYKTYVHKHDLNKGVKNIFNTNPILGNHTKRIYYTKWIESIDFSDNYINKEIRKMLRKVF